MIGHNHSHHIRWYLLAISYFKGMYYHVALKDSYRSLVAVGDVVRMFLPVVIVHFRFISSYPSRLEGTFVVVVAVAQPLIVHGAIFRSTCYPGYPKIEWFL